MKQHGLVSKLGPLREHMASLEYQLELYEKMFKAQDDMIIDLDEKIKELKGDNNRPRQSIDKLQKSENYNNGALYVHPVRYTQ